MKAPEDLHKLTVCFFVFILLQLTDVKYKLL